MYPLESTQIFHRITPSTEHAGPSPTGIPLELQQQVGHAIVIQIRHPATHNRKHPINAQRCTQNQVIRLIISGYRPK
jgi:hypothetical protein